MTAPLEIIQVICRDTLNRIIIGREKISKSEAWPGAVSRTACLVEFH